TDDMTAEALYRMGHAADAAALREALRLFHSPQQNIVYADTAGAIGFVAAGRVPVRKALSAGSQMPAPGWSGDYDWSGFLPFDALPQILKPASGRIVTANNDITPPDYPHFIAARWEAPFRAERIEAMLEGRRGLTAAEMGAMQMDELSVPAKELLPRLLAALPPVPAGPAAEALTILRGWDHRMARDQPAPLIFAAWMGEIDRRLFGPELGPFYEAFIMWNGNGGGALLAGLRGSG